MIGRTIRITIVGVALAAWGTVDAAALDFGFGFSYRSGGSCYSAPVYYDDYGDYGRREYVYYDYEPIVVYRRSYRPRVVYYRERYPQRYSRVRIYSGGRSYYRRSRSVYHRVNRRWRPYASRVYYRSAVGQRRYYGGSAYYRRGSGWRYGFRGHYRPVSRRYGGLTIRYRH